MQQPAPWVRLRSACLCAAMASLAACGNDAPIDALADTTVEPRAEPVAVPSVSIASGAAEIRDGYTQEGQQIAEGYGMTFSESAMDEVIPALPVFGFANGQPFNAGNVTFRDNEEGVWRIEISDHRFDPLKGPAQGRYEKSDMQTVSITLPQEPAPGETYGKAMSYGGGIFQIKDSLEADHTWSWNTSFAYKLEIDAWEKGPSQGGSCGRPSIGKATGRVYASFKATAPESRIESSWISGQFENAPVLYCPR